MGDKKTAKVVKMNCGRGAIRKGRRARMGGRHFYTYDAFSEVSLTGAYVIYSAGPQPSLAR